MWDVQIGQAVFRAFPLNEPPRTAEFSPDGRHLAIAAGSRVFVFDTKTGRPPAELHHPKGVRIARFHRGGSVLVSAAENEIYLWDPTTHEPLRPPLRHETWVADAAISPDGQYVVAVGGNGVLMGWQTAGGRLDTESTIRLAHLLSCTAVDHDETVPASAALWKRTGTR